MKRLRQVVPVSEEPILAALGIGLAAHAASGAIAAGAHKAYKAIKTKIGSKQASKPQAPPDAIGKGPGKKHLSPWQMRKLAQDKNRRG